jgi:SAM-dependent methyltransferase
MLLLGANLSGRAPHASAQSDDPQVKVPYVPTAWPIVEAMLELGQVGRDDFLIDLGSGDGRVVIEAARIRGARGIGVELDADLVKLSNDEARRFGVAARAQFLRQDLFETDLTQATVITMYLLPQINLALRPRLATGLKPGTRIVSHDFGMGDWLPDRQVKVPAPEKSYGPPYSTLHLWVVPAFVTGVWEGRFGDASPGERYQVDLRQQFQRLSGTMRIGGRTAKLAEATLAGDRVSFSAVFEDGTGRVRHAFDGRSAAGELAGVWRVSGAGAAVSETQTRAQRV